MESNPSTKDKENAEEELKKLLRKTINNDQDLEQYYAQVDEAYKTHCLIARLRRRETKPNESETVALEDTVTRFGRTAQKLPASTRATRSTAGAVPDNNLTLKTSKSKEASRAEFTDDFIGALQAMNPDVYPPGQIGKKHT